MPTNPMLDPVPQSYNDFFGTGDPLGQAIFGGGDGGQTASFVDSRSASGRSIFTGREIRPDRASRIRRLFD